MVEPDFFLIAVIFCQVCLDVSLHYISRQTMRDMHMHTRTHIGVSGGASLPFFAMDFSCVLG